MIRLPATGSTPIGVELQKQQETGAVGKTAAATLQTIADLGGPLFAGFKPEKGNLATAKQTCQAELARLSSRAVALQAEATKLGQDLSKHQAEAKRLTGILGGLVQAKVEVRGEVTTAKDQRRADFEEAKSLVDTHLASLKALGASDGDLAAARKRILIGLAKNAIRAGSKHKHKHAHAIESVKAELGKLKAELFPRSAGAPKAKVDAVFASIEADVSKQQGQIASKQRVVVTCRDTLAAVDKKHQAVEARVTTANGEIQRCTKRLGEIQPALDKLSKRIEQLKQAISLIDVMTHILNAEAEASAKQSEEILKQIDEAHDEERIADLRKQAQKLQESISNARRSRSKAVVDDAQRRQVPEAKVDQLQLAVTALRAEAQKTGVPAVAQALAAVERLLNEIIGEATARPARRTPHAAASNA